MQIPFRFINSISICIFIVLAFFTNSPAVSEQPAKKFKLGVILPLSGDLAFFGSAHINSTKLVQAALKNLDANIEIIYEDSAYDTKKALTAYRKLTAINKVDAIYSFGGPMLSALAPIAEADKIPFFAPESEIKDVKGKQFVSLFRNEIGEYGRVIWSVLREQNKKSIGIVRNKNQFMNTFVRGIQDNAKEGEKVSIEIDETPGTSDLRTQILKLKNKQFDALGVFFLPGSHRAFLTQSQELGIKFPMLGVEEFIVPDENAGLEKFIEGTLVVAPYVAQTFRDQYKKQFGSDLGIEYGVEYYDFLTLLNDTVQSSKFENAKEFVDAMHFKGEKQGIGGIYSFKSFEDAAYYSFPIAVYKVENKNLILYKLFERPV